MYMRKKQGVIMLEVLILLNILMVLIIYNAKTIISNSSKYQLYEIKEDILYISEFEYEILGEVSNNIKNDEELFKNILNYKDDLTIKYNYEFSKNRNLIFIIDNGNIFLKEVLEKKGESIREIEVLFIGIEEDKKIIFKPKLYKIFYMVS